MKEINDWINETRAQAQDARAMRCFGERLKAWLSAEVAMPGFQYVGTLVVLNSVVARAEASLAVQLARPAEIGRLADHHAELASECRRYHFRELLTEAKGREKV